MFGHLRGEMIVVYRHGARVGAVTISSPIGSTLVASDESPD